ncbi:MAG: hypothetical protein HC930_08805 [Hydrococcus sp. SU_1_0]|nr:hypothetical protein [Hydrococcus sp. SU_1_0]
MKHHTNGLLIGIISLMRYCVSKSGTVVIYSLLGLSFNPLGVRAEDNILVIHAYNGELASTKQNQSGIEQGFAEIESQSNIYHEFSTKNMIFN